MVEPPLCILNEIISTHFLTVIGNDEVFGFLLHTLDHWKRCTHSQSAEVMTGLTSPIPKKRNSSDCCGDNLTAIPRKCQRRRHVCVGVLPNYEMPPNANHLPQWEPPANHELLQALDNRVLARPLVQPEVLRCSVGFTCATLSQTS
jgi:hypothetical protein